MSHFAGFIFRKSSSPVDVDLPLAASSCTLCVCPDSIGRDYFQTLLNFVTDQAKQLDADRDSSNGFKYQWERPGPSGQGEISVCGSAATELPLHVWLTCVSESSRPWQKWNVTRGASAQFETGSYSCSLQG